jgi:hypothetical protein
MGLSKPVIECFNKEKVFTTISVERLFAAIYVYFVYCESGLSWVGHSGKPARLGSTAATFFADFWNYAPSRPKQSIK